ncbi:MAG: aldehyde ferredoxin oxidoreductase N-terminal domain-containing protein [Candidatus Cloacimonadales bacterium]
MKLNDTISKVLYINLTDKSYQVKDRQDLFEKYIGGTGVAIQLLQEECPPGCDALGPDNPIIIAAGPLTPVFPLASKTVALFKSPHTGNLGESHCGGRTAVALRMAGLGAVVISGKSEMPIYISIHDNKVYFRDARTLWGISDVVTIGKIIRENEPGAGTRTIMRIGRAGEELVTYANVTAETYRHFGRLGLGAVFGSKQLKALVVSGKRSFNMETNREFKELYQEIYDKSVNSALMKKYHDLGTPANVKSLNEFGGLPTKNLQKTQFDEAEEITGEYLAEHYLGRRLACSNCPVGCIHIAALREPHAAEPYFFKTSMITYDYEPIYSIGSMLGISQAKGFLKLMDRVEALGMDVMSLGVILAWATEAMEKGLIDEKITEGIKFEWNNAESYMQAVNAIARRDNEFYYLLGQGVEAAAAKYGGADFALSMGGNEMAGYHTGPACHVGALIGGRHGHLDNGGYSFDQKLLVKEEVSAEKLAKILVEEESWRQVLSSLTICFFARGVYDDETVLRALQVCGYDYEAADLKRIGKEIHRAKFDFKKQEGFDFAKLKISQRILDIPTTGMKFDKQYLEAAIKEAEKLIFS